MGGVQAVQTATIVFALPFAGVMLLAIALWRGVRNDWNEEQRRATRQSPAAKSHR